jgi:hypothetical protein
MVVAAALIFGYSTTFAAQSANLSGPWNYTLTGTGGKTRWSVYVLQVGPMLAGKATLSSGCTANIAGTVNGKRFHMKWSCPSEVVKLRGAVRKSQINGTYVDSKRGTGRFIAKKGSNEDDGSGDDGGGNGGDGGSGDGHHGGDA